MRISCPNCRADLEVLDGADVELSCPSCGSAVSPLDPTKTYRSPSKFDRVSHFELQEPVGEGAHGAVWRARDIRMDRVVALKVPRRESRDEGALAELLHEARAAGNLEHPNIVTVYEVSDDPNEPFIASSFIHGVTLDEFIAQRAEAGEPLDFKEIAHICIALADALDHAHKADVIHRDIKPRNVLVNEDGVPFLTDFGLAKHGAADYTITSSGQIVGTMRYMPPEQAKGGAGQVDGRADTYSLGLILYELLTGRAAFQGDYRTIHWKVLNQDPPAPRRENRAIPQDLETICLKAIDKDRRQRFATAADMATQLRLFCAGEPLTIRRAGPVKLLLRWTRKHSVQIALTALAFIALFLAGVMYWPEPSAHQWVEIETTLSDAELAFVPVTPQGELLGDQVVRVNASPAAQVRLLPGRYFVEAGDAEFGFAEVYRTVPAKDQGSPDGTYKHLFWERDGSVVKLPKIIVIRTAQATADMTSIRGGEFDVLQFAGNGFRPTPVRLNSYYLDRDEVSVQEYLDAGRPLPRELEGAPVQQAISHINYHQALEYAELVGKRLPFAHEHSFALTNGGKTRLPWGDAPLDAAMQWNNGQVVGTPTPDVSQHVPPLLRLASGKGEWTDELFVPQMGDKKVLGWEKRMAQLHRFRVVRGAPNSVLEGKPGSANEFQRSLAMPVPQSIETIRQLPGVTIRCAKSATPIFLPTANKP